MIAEPDVALTDYGLAVECGVFAWLLHGKGPLARWSGLFFGATAVASLAGGTVHGFFPDPAGVGSRVLWPTALLAIGVAALAAWAVGAHVLLPSDRARWVVGVAVLQLAAYAALLASGTQVFVAAVYDYLPAAAFLLLALGAAFLRTRERPPLLGAAGVGLTFVAAGVQQARVPLHPTYFGPNALYHVIQAIALGLLFGAARWLGRREAC